MLDQTGIRWEQETRIIARKEAEEPKGKFIDYGSCVSHLRISGYKNEVFYGMGRAHFLYIHQSLNFSDSETQDQ